jgi:WD40 repeat protein
VFDSASGKLLHGLRGHDDGVYSLSFSPDGTFLVSGSEDGTVRRWELPSEKEAACLYGHTDAVYQVGFSQDGQRILSTSIDGQLLIRDGRSGVVLYSHRFPSKPLCAALTPDGRQVGTGTARAACYLLELPHRAW